MKAAVIQLGAGKDKRRNIERAVWWVHQAASKKAKFVVLPEAFNFRGKGGARRGFQDYAEIFPGPSTIPLMEAAKVEKIFILAGSICESVPGNTKVYNASVLINSKGDIVAKYRKRNLFNALFEKASVDESKFFLRGKKGALAKIGPWSVGMSICYDLRFPMLYQEYARKGADVLCVPSAFTKTTGQAHWEVLLRARAIENLCYVLAPNQIGNDGRGVISYGNSMIISPWGELLARASEDKEEILVVQLDKNYLTTRRKILPGQQRK